MNKSWEVLFGGFIVVIITFFVGQLVSSSYQVEIKKRDARIAEFEKLQMQRREAQGLVESALKNPEFTSRLQPVELALWTVLAMNAKPDLDFKMFKEFLQSGNSGSIPITARFLGKFGESYMAAVGLSDCGGYAECGFRPQLSFYVSWPEGGTARFEGLQKTSVETSEHVGNKIVWKPAQGLDWTSDVDGFKETVANPIKFQK